MTPEHARVTLPPLHWRKSPNASSRRGMGIAGIVIHETQGRYEGAVSWLCNPAANASAHVVLDETGNRCTQLVAWGAKAWHAFNANAYTLGLELAGAEATANSEWQLARAARITAFWCQEFGIPPRQGDRYGRNGIVRHEDLGEYGGGHHDPGGFNWGRFLASVKAEYTRGRFRAVWGAY